jgi:hypothetical protein
MKGYGNSIFVTYFSYPSPGHRILVANVVRVVVLAEMVIMVVVIFRCLFLFGKC